MILPLPEENLMDIALLYRARVVAPPGASSFDLDALAEMRRALEVKGFLLLAHGCAYELLEGEFTAVSRAFSALLISDWLEDIQMLSNAAILSRVCAHWSYGRLERGDDLWPDLITKVQMLHHFADRFGPPQPVLRDFLTCIGRRFAASALPGAPSRSGIDFVFAG